MKRFHFGHDPAKTKARVLDAVRRAQAGPVSPEDHVTFEGWRARARYMWRSLVERLVRPRRSFTEQMGSPPGVADVEIEFEPSRDLGRAATFEDE